MQNLVWNVIAWIVVVTARFLNKAKDSSKNKVIVLDDEKSRELRRIQTMCSAVYLYDVVNTHESCVNADMVK